MGFLLKKTIGGYARDRRGAAAVEFALVAPILILIIAAMYDFGLFIHQQMQMENLARNAAEYVVKGGEEANVMTDVVAGSGLYDMEELSNISISSAYTCECSDGAEVSCETGTCDDSYVRHFYSIEISREHQTVFPYPGLPETMSMSGDARLQVQ